MNFKNSNPPAEQKRNHINDMVERSKVSNALGRELENKAKSFVEDAKNAYALLNVEGQSMDGSYLYFNNKLIVNICYIKV